MLCIYAKRGLEKSGTKAIMLLGAAYFLFSHIA